MEQTVKYKLRKGDTVKIVTGKDSSKSNPVGKVVKIDRDSGRIIVEGLNMVKKAVKPKKQNDKGGISEIEGSVDISNVMIVCKKCGPTRIGIEIKGEQKTRICKKCKEAL